MRLDIGRTGQKARTRRTLLDAAQRLMDRGEAITINAVADEAAISRATAYRYFSDPDGLMLEAMLDAQFKSPAEVVGDATDVRERVHRVQRYLMQATRDAEARFRLFLARALQSSVRQGLNSAPIVRGGRRLPMYELALAPVRGEMTRREFELLVLCLSAASGVESFLALKDVCRLDDATADQVGAAIIDAILDSHLPAKQSGRARRSGTPATPG